VAKPEKLVNGVDLLEWLDNNVKSQPTFSDVTKGINEMPDASEPLRERVAELEAQMDLLIHELEADNATHETWAIIEQAKALLKEAENA
jgi:tetrahydromethanopterin S-methyltransferase subunit B